MDTKFQAHFTRSYDDFEPSFNWVREEGLDTLVLHLPGFKKEQLRVQVDTHGNLKVTGERPLEERKWSRFRKDFPVPNYCNVNDINAKFIGGLLYIKFPKKPIQIIPQNQPTPQQETSPIGQNIGSDRKPWDKEEKAMTNGVNNSGGISGSTKNGEDSGVGGVCRLSMHRRKVESEGVLVKLSKHRKLIVGVAVLVATVVAAGVYLTCNLTSSPVGEDGGH